MHDWQHAIAGGVLAVAVFLLICGVTAPLSTLVWRLRRRINLADLKVALALVTLLPLQVAVLVAFSFSLPSCVYQSGCYAGWLQHLFGAGFSLWMRPIAVFVGGILVVWIARLVYRGASLIRTMCELYAHSHPPSPKLLTVLRQVVPQDWHSRFREVDMPSEADGVYGGTCLLSRETVGSLNEAQLKAVVAHEYQHLRAGDGWFALWVGLLVNSTALGIWNMAYRYWSRAAELLADARAAQSGVARTELARALLNRQAEAQGMVLGFASEGILLEERLQSLLASQPLKSSARVTWVLIAVCVGGVLYLVSKVGAASTCTVHCVLF
ncbi:MAG: hypothetical protein HPY54_05385 [Chthonomonadetes bacterium]|nr:hypothetical protein [Chthonomonadetes bacterium]